jgi:SOS-response transcriptional repressor LexA
MALHEKGDDTRKEILAFIKSYWRTNGISPTFREIITGTSVTTTSVVSYHLDVLQEEGLLTYQKNTNRSIKPTGMRVVFEDVKS